MTNNGKGCIFITLPKIVKKGGDEIKFCLLITIFIFVYECLKLFKLSKIKRKYITEYSNINSIKRSKSSSLIKVLYKIPILKEIEIKLYKLGNPYKLNLLRYILVKITLFVFFLINSLINFNSYFTAILIAIFAQSLIDILIYLYAKNQNNEILKDLLNIIDNIYLQMSSNIAIDKILKSAALNCKNEILRKSFINMSNVYEYTGYNIHMAIREIREKINLVEIDMFCNGLIEQITLGENLMVFENLSNILTEKYLEKVKQNTKNKVLLITGGIGITLLNISLIVFYPILNSFKSGFNDIFY